MFQSFCKRISSTKVYDEDYLISIFQHFVKNTQNNSQKKINELSFNKMKIDILETESLIQVSIFTRFDTEFQKMWKFITDAYVINNKIFIDDKKEKPSFFLAITTKSHQNSDFVIFYDPEIINYTSSNIHQKPDIINLIFKKEKCFYKK